MIATGGMIPETSEGPTIGTYALHDLLARIDELERRVAALEPKEKSFNERFPIPFVLASGKEINT